MLTRKIYTNNSALLFQVTFQLLSVTVSLLSLQLHPEQFQYVPTVNFQWPAHCTAATFFQKMHPFFQFYLVLFNLYLTRKAYLRPKKSDWNRNCHFSFAYPFSSRDFHSCKCLLFRLALQTLWGLTPQLWTTTPTKNPSPSPSPSPSVLLHFNWRLYVSRLKVKDFHLNQNFLALFLTYASTDISTSFFHLPPQLSLFI